MRRQTRVGRSDGIRGARAGQDAPPCLKLLKRLRHEAKRKPRFRFASRKMPWKAFFQVPLKPTLLFRDARLRFSPVMSRRLYSAIACTATSALSSSAPALLNLETAVDRLVPVASAHACWRSVQVCSSPAGYGTAGRPTTASRSKASYTSPIIVVTGYSSARTQTGLVVAEGRGPALL